MKSDNSNIHPTAVISDGACIGDGTTVGPYSVIGPKVKIGEHCRIDSHVVIEGKTTIGSGNHIYQFASIGSHPQDLKYKGEESRLEVGDNNILREYVTLQPGTSGGGMVTKVGDRNLFMVSSHLGHDCTVGNDNIIANCVAFAGHVTIGNKVTLGGLSAIHQFVQIGDFALIAGGAMVLQDVPPFCLTNRNRGRLSGINVIGMERAGFSRDEIKTARKMYRFLFLSGESVKVQCATLSDNFPESRVREQMLAFFPKVKRGIASVKRSRSGDGDD